jgi:hypothetical protein
MLITREKGEDVFRMSLQTTDPELQAALGRPKPYVLPLTREELWAAVQQCRSAWRTAVDDFERDVVAPREPTALFHSLATAGYKLFQALFFPEGDRNLELREVFAVLEDLLSKKQRWIRVESSDFFAPWNLVYSKLVPLSPSADFDPSGFWGYQHLIEHVPNDAGGMGFSPQTGGGALRLSLQLDTNLDDEFHVPVVTPITELLDSYRARTVDQKPRYRHSDLATALREGPRDDHFMYFCCHAEVEGFGSGLRFDPSWISLSDRPQQRITPDDITWWLGRKMLVGEPVVFLNACGGGQLTSTFYEGFAKVFLSRHASAVVGPQTEVPALFAGEFARRFFEDFLSGGAQNSVGRILHRLRRSFWDSGSNPLGLVYSVYRGADIYLPKIVAQGDSDARPSD